MVTGSTEVVAQKVTEGVLVYDIATDKKVREDLQEQFREIKNQIGENPKEFFPILGEVILTVSTGNTSEDWKKAVHSKDIGERSHLATRGTGNAIITAVAGVAIVKDLPEIVNKLSEAVKKSKLVGKYDWGIVRKYFNHIQEVTKRQVHQKQISKLKEALRNKEYKRLSESEIAIHRADFNSRKLQIIKDWELETGQKWPIYTESVYSKNGIEIRKPNDLYDAHHIIENKFGGDNEWWNIHPAKFPDEHQKGIHGSGSPSRELFK